MNEETAKPKRKKQKAFLVYFRSQKQMDTIRRAAKKKELSFSRFLVNAGLKEAEAQLDKRSA